MPSGSTRRCGEGRGDYPSRRRLPLIAAPSIFISYAHEDRGVARVLAATLDQRGCRVWIDEGELRTGDSLAERIADAVDELDFLVALVSPASVESDWCRRELRLAVAGELELGLPAPKVLPLRLGEVTMPPIIRDKLYRSVELDRPERVVDQLYQDILYHHQRMSDDNGVEEGQGADLAAPVPEGTPPPVARAASPPMPSGDAHAVRATFIELRQRGDEIGLEELLRAERRTFAERCRALVAEVQEEAPGPSVDLDRFADLEAQLSAALERRWATLFPLVQYGPCRLLHDEIRAIADLAGEDWRLGPGNYAEWMESPRWLAWSLAWAIGVLACARRRFEVVRLLWSVRTSNGKPEPLPAIRLLAATNFARALERARFGKELALGPFWHLAAILAKSDLCATHYPELGEVLERSLHQLANFSWLVTALAGRDEVQVIKWWAGVTDFARDEAGASMAAEMDADPELLGNVAESVFHLPRAEESLVQIGRWVLEARGPETFF